MYDIHGVNNKINVKSKIKENFLFKMLERLNTYISNKRKLRTYALSKTTFKFENYLNVISDLK